MYFLTIVRFKYFHNLDFTYVCIPLQLALPVIKDLSKLRKEKSIFIFIKSDRSYREFYHFHVFIIMSECQMLYHCIKAIHIKLKHSKANIICIQRILHNKYIN